MNDQALATALRNDSDLRADLVTALRQIDSLRTCACWDDNHITTQHRFTIRSASRLIERVVLDMLGRDVDPPAA